MYTYPFRRTLYHNTRGVSKCVYKAEANSYGDPVLDIGFKRDL